MQGAELLYAANASGLNPMSDSADRLAHLIGHGLDPDQQPVGFFIFCNFGLVCDVRVCKGPHARSLLSKGFRHRPPSPEASKQQGTGGLFESDKSNQILQSPF
jgi:hypothetical protein